MENLTKKEYAKYDRIFMAFGSLMNSLQHIINEKNKEEIANWAWEWSKTKVSALVDELYENSRLELRQQEKQVERMLDVELDIQHEADEGELPIINEE